MTDINLSNFTLSFSDEFESLDLQSNNGTWRTSYYDGNDGRVHGDELQIYVDYSYLGLNIDPFSISNGVLTIHAQAATTEVAAATGHDYTSGMLSSSGAFSQTYGYFEIRCDTPETTGTWPAFWLLPANGSWPPELDVFETLGNDTSKVYTTVHSAQTGSHEQSGISAAVPIQSDGMHTYGVLWTKDELVWYIDGQEVYRTATPADMHQPMYMVTDLAIGGWAGNPDAGFTGADYKVDYIRAYTLDSSPYPNIVSVDHTFALDKVANGLILTGTGDINGTGNALDNTLTGNTGNNILDGGAGADTMAGGLGNDTYRVDSGADIVGENADAGTDRIISSVSLRLVDNVENLTLSGTADINATGNGLDNALTGNAGNNILDGGSGADAMAGGLGNDTYYVDNTGDAVNEWSNEGTDTVNASVSFSLLTHAENLVLTGTANINATGNWLDNTLTGNAGNNVLDGCSGADIMAGGAGNDTYYVDSSTDVVTEWSGQGTDTVIATNGSYTLGANVENLVLASTWSSNGTGNALNNTLSGNASDNALDGGTGADTMAGGLGNDTYYVDNTADVVNDWSNQGTDTVYASVSFSLLTHVENLTLTGTANIDATGNWLNNTLTGNAGNNVLDGGTGIDAMVGGAGNDTYYVDNGADVVTEWYGQGTDTVYASCSYTLSANVENLVLSSAWSGNITGNALNNVLTGNAAANTLDGGTGADLMVGGSGDDTYFVDNSSDVVSENPGSGIDRVFSSISLTLAANVENLTLTGTSDLKGAGNELENALTGNAGSNTLNGGLGADTMAGGQGDDTYYVDNSGDVVTEWFGQGTDTVMASISHVLGANVENLTLTGTAGINATGNGLDNALSGNAGNNILDGGAGADTLSGGAGNDRLIGGMGADIMSGGGGSDVFSFASVDESGTANRDTITDFSSADVIDLGGVFSGTLSYLHTGAFTGAAGEVQITASANGTLVNIDTTGDCVADMQIYLQNATTSSLAVSGANFIL